MDLQRSLSRWQRWRSRALKPALALGLVACLAGAVWALSHAPGAAEHVVASRGVSLATVEQGPLAIDVRGSGVLLPRDPRWIAAQSEARVERLLALPGSRLAPGDLILQLSNPQLHQRAQESRSQLQQAEAELKALSLSLSSQAMNQRAATQRAGFALRQAELQWQADQELLKDGMVSKLAYQRSRFNVEQAQQTLQLERELLAQHEAAMQAQLDAKRALIARLQQALQRDLDLVDALSVRAPGAGVLLELALQAGQSVAAGSNLAKLALGDALYAELQIQEAQARDIAIGQAVQLDLRSGTADGQLQGRVSRVAPKLSNGLLKIDVSIESALPKGARPDLNVDGVIALNSLANALQVQRPLFSQGMSEGQVYRLVAEGLLERTTVRFGPASVNRIAIVQGLRPGDRIVTSDTSSWGQSLRVQLR